jgi:hypothetical protein
LEGGLLGAYKFHNKYGNTKLSQEELERLIESKNARKREKNWAKTNAELAS